MRLAERRKKSVFLTFLSKSLHPWGPEKMTEETKKGLEEGNSLALPHSTPPSVKRNVSSRAGKKIGHQREETELWVTVTGPQEVVVDRRHACLSE